MVIEGCTVEIEPDLQNPGWRGIIDGQAHGGDLQSLILTTDRTDGEFGIEMRSYELLFSFVIPV